MQPAFPAKVLPPPPQADGRFLGVSTNPPATLLKPLAQRNYAKAAKTARQARRNTSRVPGNAPFAPLCVSCSPCPGNTVPHKAHSTPSKTQAGRYDCHWIGSAPQCPGTSVSGQTRTPGARSPPSTRSSSSTGTPVCWHFLLQDVLLPTSRVRAMCKEGDAFSCAAHVPCQKKRAAFSRASVRVGGSFIRPMQTAQTTSRQYYPVPPNRTLLHQTPLLPQPPYPKPTPFP